MKKNIKNGEKRLIFIVHLELFNDNDIVRYLLLLRKKCVVIFRIIKLIINMNKSIDNRRIKC